MFLVFNSSKYPFYFDNHTLNNRLLKAKRMNLSNLYRTAHFIKKVVINEPYIDIVSRGSIKDILK